MKLQTFKTLEKEAYIRKELLEAFAKIDAAGGIMCAPELLEDYVIEGGEHYPDDRRLSARYRHYVQWITVSSKVYNSLTGKETKECFLKGLSDILHTGIPGGVSRICFSNNIIEALVSRIGGMAGMGRDVLSKEMQNLKNWVAFPHEGLSGGEENMLDIRIFEECVQYIKQAVKDKEESEYVNKLINTLLDVALQLTGAESGSIMMLDKASQRLSVRASKGLKEEDLKDVSVKMGEGIAGKVAQEQHPLFLNDKSEDVIKGRFTKPWIKSSMVVPLRMGLEGESYGVINISSTKELEKLNQENAELLYKLFGMMSSPVAGIGQEELVKVGK